MLSRLEFLRRMALGMAGTFLFTSGRAIPTPETRTIYRGYVRGLAHYNFYDLQEQLEPQTPLTLVREPDNEHDYKAISVYGFEKKLGYIAREDNKVLAWMIDSGFDLFAEVRRLNDDDSLWRALRIEIKTYSIKLNTRNNMKES